MNISIIICTYNRSQSLQRTLDSIREMVLSEKLEWELIVIDNNSTDNTKQTVNSFQQSCHFAVRYVFEKKQGLSFARNRGVQEAKGEILAFTDDDMYFDKNWVETISKVFLSVEEKIVFGRVMPGEKSPIELSTKKDFKEKKYSWPCSPWGIGHGNSMYINRSLFKKIGLFDIKFGAGTFTGSAEDTDFIYRILKKGYKIFYSPGIVNYHNHDRVGEEDVDAIRFNYAKGRGAFYTKHILRGDSYAARLCYWEIKSILINFLRYEIISNNQYRKNILLNLKGLALGFYLRLTTKPFSIIKSK